MAEMIMASLSKIWHLIPIVMAIVLFKIFINKRDKKNRINKNEENEKNGLTLELRTVKKYEKSGYKVEEGAKDQGIDLICSKGDKTLLIQCKNTSESKSITDEDIKQFRRSALEYAKTNDMKQNSVSFRYVVPYRDVLHKSAVKILTNNSYNCKYAIL